MIRLNRVRKSYTSGGQQVEALQELTEHIAGSEFVLLTGRSGAGKSTLLSLVGGLIRPDAGTVEVAGRDLWSMPDRERSLFRCRAMGFVFQFASLVPTLTVLENVLLPSAFLPADERNQDTLSAGELLERVGLGGLQGRLPWQLSGGQQKRVAVARALLHRPSLILADEPTADLDEETEAEILQLFVDLNRQGTTVLLATHNLDLARLATRHLMLAGGQVRRVS